MITIGAYLAAALLALTLIGGVHVWHSAKRAAHKAGCAVERVVGRKCKEKLRALTEPPHTFESVLDELQRGLADGSITVDAADSGEAADDRGPSR
jgi:hypothetical protein